MASGMGAIGQGIAKGAGAVGKGIVKANKYTMGIGKKSSDPYVPKTAPAPTVTKDAFGNLALDTGSKAKAATAKGPTIPERLQSGIRGAVNASNGKEVTGPSRGMRPPPGSKDDQYQPGDQPAAPANFRNWRTR